MASIARIPGIIPAINRLPIEAFAVTPYTTIGIDGGISIPRYPAAEDNAAAYSGR